jgi:hypothetical protein
VSENRVIRAMDMREVPTVCELVEQLSGHALIPEQMQGRLAART